MTPFAHYTNSELVKLAYNNPNATPLEMEFAFRLENNYADDLSVVPDKGESGLGDLLVQGALNGTHARG